MARNTVTLGSTVYKVASQSLVPTGAKRWSVLPRPSQRGDPGPLQEALWEISGPNLFSVEKITEYGNGYLGVDYCDGTDSRWQDTCILGPAINTVTLSKYDRDHNAALIDESSCLLDSTSFLDGAQSSAAINDIDITSTAAGMSAYVSRGNFPKKIRLSDMTLGNTGVELPQPGTSLIATSAVDIGQEVSFGMTHESYVVAIPGASMVNPDVQVTTSVGAKIFGQAADRIVKLYRRNVAGNIIGTSTSMRIPNWNTVSDINAMLFEMTGFALDGRDWVIGTSRGPFVLNPDTGTFYPLIPEIGASAANCHQMEEWSYFGIKVPLRDGMRYVRYGQSESIGLERFEGNTSVVRGYPTAQAHGTRWGYEAWYDEVTADTWICAVRPRQSGEQHPNPQSYYVIAHLTDLQCKAMKIFNDETVRANPTLLFGYGSNLGYMTLGRGYREIDDTNYTFQAGGSTHFTELRREPALIKDPEALEFETDDCTANRTVAIKLSADGASAVTLATITSDGFQRVLPVSSEVPLTTVSGRRLKPVITLASNVATTSPRVTGKLKMTYRVRPLTVNDYQFTLVLNDDLVGTAQGKADALLALTDDQNVLLKTDEDQEYVKLMIDAIHPAKDDGGDVNSASGITLLAQCRAVTVPTVSGQ